LRLARIVFDQEDVFDAANVSDQEPLEFTAAISARKTVPVLFGVLPMRELLNRSKAGRTNPDPSWGWREKGCWSFP
jgi:hypothetical protein